MIKKIALASILLGTLANAEIDQTGFFVGIDGSKSSNIMYENTNADNPTFAYNEYTANFDEYTPSFKVGYQYYFTRLYARINSFEYTDSKRDKYTIKGMTYELNADYIPVFYMSKDKEWDIRGVFGVGVGLNTSKLENYDVALLPVDITANDSQSYVEYGLQVGLLSEISIGMSLELGLRYRQGYLQKFSDINSNEATFSRDETEYYFGVNYLF